MQNYDFKQLFDSTKKILKTAASRNVRVINISSADSSPEYEKKVYEIIHSFSAPHPVRFSSYYFTGSIMPDILRQIKKQLGAVATSGITILPSATLSISTVLMLLRQKKIRKIAIISPYYFASSVICDALGIRYKVLPALKRDGMIRIPLEAVLRGGFDAVLITSPLYGTSEYYSDEIAKDIKLLQSEKKYIILDEALALHGHELSRKSQQDDHTFYIYSPHKSIGINTFKFSAIISSASNEPILRELVDICVGGLNRTSIFAMEHYISKDFLYCRNEYMKTIDAGTKQLMKTLLLLGGQMFLSHGQGHYASVVPGVDFPGDQIYIHAITSCVREHNIAFIPPWPAWHDGFKINLTYPPDVIAEATKCIAGHFRSSIRTER